MKSVTKSVPKPGTQPLKLAFCLFNYFPFGGLQRDFLRIARACLAAGHSVDVYTQSWEGAEEEGLKLELLPVKGQQNHSRSQAFAENLSQRLANKNYDWVMGFNKMPGLDIYYAADVCYQTRIKEQRPFWYRWLPRYQQYLKNEAAVFSPQAKTEILVLSAAQRDEYSRCYQMPLERFHLLPPGISKDRLAPANAEPLREAIRKEQQIEADEKVLLMVGSGFKTKGLDRIIRGLAALPEGLRQKTKLWVLGQDHPKPFLKLAKRLGVAEQLHFLGGRHEVLRYFLAADLLVHPAYHENTGTVLLEALAAGLPVLTVEVCGYASYVETAKAGLVLPAPFKQASFNQSLESMLLSPSVDEWRSNALTFAKTADIYSLPQKALTFIEALKKHD